PDLIQRNDMVTIIYEAPGLLLTLRGKAADSGAQGDTISVLNLQSKRTVQGTVTGPGQVTIAATTPRVVSELDTAAAAPSQSQTAGRACGTLEWFSCPMLTCPAASRSRPWRRPGPDARPPSA